MSLTELTPRLRARRREHGYAVFDLGNNVPKTLVTVAIGVNGHDDE